MSRNILSMDRETLIEQIKEWNANRLDLFALTLPDDKLEFFGVMRFFFQDTGAKVATKCVRVSSSASTPAVVETLIEKFRPDMRMLTMDRYCLYEVHANREERKLDEHDRPLLVQLNWGLDDREGRFLLKRERDVTAHMEGFHERPTENTVLQRDKKRLSKRDKKELKKKEKQAKLTKGKENETPGEKLYKELPETSFTRTISNPDAVMRRRRQQKLERKMQEFRGKDGGPDGGGTLKVFGHTLNADVPYKTLLLSTEDSADFVVKETLEKYKMERENPQDYCLFMLHLVPAEDGREGNVVRKEEILNEDECPLAIQLHHHPARGSLLFEIRKLPANAKRRPRSQGLDPGFAGYDAKAIAPNKLPFLMELHPDGTEPYNPVRHRIQDEVVEVGSGNMPPDSQHLRLHGPHIMPRHCVVAHSDGVVTVTPVSKDAETYINNQRIIETTVLQNGMTVRFGKSHLFRFMDPLADEKMKRGPASDSSLHGPGHYDPRYGDAGPMEASFDVDGHSEPGGRLDPRGYDDPVKRSPDGGPPGGPSGLISGPRQLSDDLLPAGLQFMEDAEDHLLTSIILNPAVVNTIQFKLAPTYTLYTAVRYRLSRHYRPDMGHQERTHRMAALIDKIATLIQQIVKENPEDANILAFWMANASELLHFFKKDDNVSPYCADSLDMLAGVVQLAFRSLVNVLQADMDTSMGAFLDEANPDDDNEEDFDDNQMNKSYGRNRPVMSDVISTLSAAMSLMRRCRVNAALTIQLFSLLFHYVNMWLFNRIVLEPRLQLCSRYWGVLLKRRLARVEIWAEKQGLELAADCHLARIVQTAYLLQCPKYSVDDATNISSLCFKLNSLQIRVLLESYLQERDEPYVPQDLITRLVRMAESTADEMVRSEGRSVHLEEDPDLHLPFLLPEDGYSCEIIEGVPNGLPEFVEPFSKNGLCALIPHQNVNGSWMVYMDNGQAYSPNMSPQQYPSPPASRSADLLARRLPPEPDITVIQFDKVRGSLGLSIVAAQGEGQKERGVYVKAVVPGGAAALDGRIQAGDQMLEVDGRSLSGLTQEKAAELMVQTGNRVTLKLAVQGAVYHGLESMLSKPSPTMQRAADARSHLPPAESGRDAMPMRGLQHQQLAQSRSTSALNEQFPTDPYRESYMTSHQTPPAKDRSKSVSNLRQEAHEEDRRRLQSTGSAPKDRFHHASQPSLNISRDDVSPHREDPRYTNFQHKNDRQMPVERNMPVERPLMVERPMQGVERNMPMERPMQGVDRNMPIERPMQGVERNMPMERPLMVERPMQGVERNMPVERPLVVERPMPGVERNMPVERPLMVERPMQGVERHMQGVERPMPGVERPQQGAPPMSGFGVQLRHNHERPIGDRPKSAMFPQHRDEPPNRPRPKSEDIDVDITPDWRQRMEPPKPVIVNKEPPRLENGDIPLVKRTNGQPHFFDNTQYRQREASPPFEQLRLQERPSIVKSTQPKPRAYDGPTIVPGEIMKISVDNTSSQAQFFAPPSPSPDERSSRYEPSRHEQRFDTKADRSEPTRMDSRVDLRNGLKIDTRPEPARPDPRNERPRLNVNARLDPSQLSPAIPNGPEVDRVDARMDSRADPRMDSRADPRNDSRIDSRVDSRLDLRMDSRVDLRMDSRQESIKMDPRFDSNRMDPRADPGRMNSNRTEPVKQEQRNSMSNLRSVPPRPGSPEFPPPPQLGPPSDDGDDGQLPPPPPPPQDYTNRYSGSYAHLNQPAPFTAAPSQIQSIRFQPQKPAPQPKPERPNSSGPINAANMSGPSSMGSASGQLGPRPKSLLAVSGQATMERAGSPSPWDRDKKEEDMKRQEEELARMRDEEIELLEAKQRLTAEEQARLQRLRLDQEFRRRVAELPRSDEEEDENETERIERAANRDRMVKMVKEDLERAHKLKAERDELDRQEEIRREQELKQKQEHRLSLLDKEREEQRLKLQRKHERQEREQEMLLRKQRDLHEKQRQEQEENKRFIAEEEKRIEVKRLEEIRRKKEQERQQLREMELAREAEEEEKRQKERLSQIRQDAKEEFHKPSYQIGFPMMGQQLPQPPQRGSSYGMLNRGGPGAREPSREPGLVKDPNVESDLYMRGFQPAPSRTLQTETPKKSVSFDSRLATEITDQPTAQRYPPPTVSRFESTNQESVPYNSNNQQYPNASFSANQNAGGQFSTNQGPSSGQFSSNQNSAGGQYSANQSAPGQFTAGVSVSGPYSNNVGPGLYSQFQPMGGARVGQAPLPAPVAPKPFIQQQQPNTPQLRNNNVDEKANYIIMNTPGVVGAQEVYRDPRDKQMAARSQQARLSQGVEPPGEQMSFREKMKMFAETAGENAPKMRVKQSRSQRVLEMNLGT